VNDLTDQQLLSDYTGRREPEAAFGELARRHVDFVYSAALRMVRDSHLAEDVTQGVFMALAQNARQLTKHPVLAGWLHRTTQNLAGKAVRSEVRRRAREQEAAAMNELTSTKPDDLWEQIAPQLDDALGDLSEADRDALLLRYFQSKSAQEMGQTLGISPEAAQKRVNRAVERIRESFAKRGVTAGASGLAVAISANAVQAAPAGLAATLSGAAFVNAAAAGGLTSLGILKIMTLTKLQTVAAAAIVVTSIATSVVIQQQAQARTRAQDDLSRQRTEQLAKLKAENDRLSALAGGPGNSGPNNLDNLSKLRAEVGALRNQTNDLAKLQADNRRLRAPNPQSPNGAKTPLEATEDARELAIAKMNFTRQWVLAFHMYAGDYKGQSPTNFDDATPYTEKARLGTNLSTSQFEVVFTGKLESVKDASTTILIREKEAAQSLDGTKWLKSYGFVDGHAEIHSEPDGNFDAYEKKHIIPRANQ
jgi:RNA polymerase sigma factor (sigma-70 family)